MDILVVASGCSIVYNNAPFRNDTVIVVAEDTPNSTVIGGFQYDSTNVTDFLLIGQTLFTLNGMDLILSGPLNFEQQSDYELTFSYNCNTVNSNITTLLSITDVNEAPSFPWIGSNTALQPPYNAIFLGADDEDDLQLSYTLQSFTRPDFVTLELDENTGYLAVYSGATQPEVAQINLNLSASDGNLTTIANVTLEMRFLAGNPSWPLCSTPL
jgi:hypothetical protein